MFRNVIEQAALRVPTAQSGGTLRYDPRNPSQTFADITRREQHRYERNYIPVENAVIGSLGDRSVIDEARDNATAGFEGLQGRQDRSLRRYGVSLDPLQQQETQRRAGMGKSLTYDSAVNDAELYQRERNDSLRNELINVGRGVAQEANAGFAEASGLQAQRDANNRAAKAQSKASAWGTAGSMASAAIMAFTFL